ncbi:MAG: cytochrome c [Gammaproteobacteria bacterium]|nr:cytochrome c [Gammaproteobacteria bacterium]
MKKLSFISVLVSALLLVGMSTAQAAGDAAAGESLYSSMGCMGCHGAAGNSAMPDMFPNLSGLDEAYLDEQLKAFKSGERQNATMQPMSANLSDADIANLAAYLAAQ